MHGLCEYYNLLCYPIPSYHNLHESSIDLLSHIHNFLQQQHANLCDRPPIAGSAVIYAIAPRAATRVGLLIAFYCTQFILAEGNMLFSLISRNVAGQTKKSTTLAIAFIAWAGGNAAAPQVPLFPQILTTEETG
jgi:hypothetical protein